MNTVLNNAVATINAYVEDFKERHKDVEIPLPPLAGEKYEGLPARVVAAYYRLDSDDRPPLNADKYGTHGLMITMRTDTVPKGDTMCYRMNFHAIDVPGLIL